MGQFKPMVKMMTTEPSIELKLKKGGSVTEAKKMMNGGVMGALASAPTPGTRGGMMPVARPKKPPMAARRAAMMGRPMMNEGGETSKEHMAEMRKMASTAKELKKHESMPASKAHAGLKTGGVVMGQGGYKEGGVIKSTKGETKMVTAEGEKHYGGKTGEVVMGKPGGYKHGGKPKKMAGGGCYAKGGGVEGNVSTSKPGPTNTTTGGVRLGNAGGYKKGGAPKKAFAAGGSVNDTGRPVAYPKKPASQSIKNTKQSGTFKHGGDVKMNTGGVPAEAKSAAKQADAERAYRDYEKAEKAENEAMRETFLGAPRRMFQAVKGLFKGEEKPAGSVTKTKESVTVAPAKKHGGRVKKC